MRIGFLGSVQVDYQVFRYLYKTFRVLGHESIIITNSNQINNLDILLVKDDCFTDTIGYQNFIRLILEAKNQGISTAIILQDLEHVYRGRTPPYYDTNKKFTELMDVVFCANPNGEPIPKELGREFVWLPNGYDPSLFFPMENTEFIDDVCFVGTNVPWIHCAVPPINISRDMLFSTLKKNFNAKIWGRFGVNKYLEDVNQVYNSFKITVNLTHSKEGVFTNRLFEAPGAGICLFTDYGTHLDLLYDVGKEVVGYRSLPELVNLIHYYLENEDERRVVALAGYQRARKNHTWVNRVKTILGAIE